MLHFSRFSFLTGSFKLALAACACSIGMATARAHDTWFERLERGAASTGAAAQLALGTGNQFPIRETGVGMEYLVRQGCRAAAALDGTGPGQAMQRERNTDNALVLRAPLRSVSCWAQLQPFDIELKAPLVAVYLKEIEAPASVRQAWAEQQAQGLSWTERYVKHARIALTAQGSDQPVPMGMDVLVDPQSTTGAAPAGTSPSPPPSSSSSSSVNQLRARQPISFVVLRDGLPLAGQAVELRLESISLGIWRRTDAQGRVQLPGLPAGHWLLRGTELRPGAAAGVGWESRFFTLAFELR